MAWSWRYEDADANEVRSESFPGETFTTQAEAETWLGETWRELLDEGVDQVTLFQGGDVVYGPMSLHPDT